MTNATNSSFNQLPTQCTSDFNRSDFNSSDFISCDDNSRNNKVGIVNSHMIGVHLQFQRNCEQRWFECAISRNIPLSKCQTLFWMIIFNEFDVKALIDNESCMNSSSNSSEHYIEYYFDL